MSNFCLNKEFVSYGFFGILTTLLHILLFYVLCFLLPYKIANIITLITIKVLAYILNKRYVFHTKCKNKKVLFAEIIKYTFSRLLTIIVDYVGLIVLVDFFSIDKMIGKILTIIIVVIINYLLCKKYVFK